MSEKLLADLMVELAGEAHIGIKKRKGGRKGHEKQRALWPEFQDYINAIHRKHPDYSYNCFKRLAAREFNCNEKTIERHTKNPKIS